MTVTGNTVSPPALIDDEGMNRKACTTYFGKSWNLQKHMLFFFLDDVQRMLANISMFQGQKSQFWCGFLNQMFLSLSNS